MAHLLLRPVFLVLSCFLLPVVYAYESSLFSSLTQHQMKRGQGEPAAVQRGKVAVGALPGRFAKNEDGTSKKWPVLEGYSRVNVCSGAPGQNKQLSPMLLGPITAKKHGWTDEDHGEKLYGVKRPFHARNLENMWQSSKVWEGEEDSTTKMPGKAWYERRQRLWRDTKGHRWVKKGKDASGNRNIALYQMWGARKLSYLEARRHIYCPIYSELVQQTDAYKKLEQRLQKGENLLLLGFDGYPQGQRTWKECFEDISKPFGHEQTLACLLQGVAPWK
jgi:hypothetical protein